jgi:hypothetical protein
MNESMHSEDSSKAQESTRGKMESLYKAFNDLNWDKQKNLTEDEIIFFLNSNSPKGKFDEDLCQNLLKFLGFENSDSITVEDFIQYYMRFDMNLQKSKEEFNNRLLTRQNTLSNLEEQCNKYKDEELDSEGFCKDAKLTVEISGIDISAELPNKNFVQILIEIIYCGQTYQKFFDINNDEQNNNKIFELKPQKKTDNFIIVLKCVSDNDEIIEIGKREFPIDQIITQDEYDAVISIPDENNENVEVATINTKIVLFWSKYQFYLEKKNETEQKIEKIKKDLSETNRFCKEINNIYLKNKKIQQQPNQNNILSNYKVIKPSTDASKTNYIDIDNNNDLNNNEYNEALKQNMFEIKSNDNYNRNSGNVNPEMIRTIKTMGVCIIALGLLNGFHKNEFHNELCGILFILSCYDIFQGDHEKAKLFNKFVFYYCLALLILDIFWIFSYFTEVYDEVNGVGPTILTKIIVALSVVAKGFSAVIIHNKNKILNF